MSNLKSILTDIDQLQLEIKQSRPLQGKNLEKVKDYWRIGLTYASNALEGNTLTETETKVLLEDGITIGGKSVREMQECLGHSNAVKFLYDQLNTSDFDYEVLLKELHRLFYLGIDEQKAGCYRKGNVIITGTDYIPPKWEVLGRQMKTAFLSLKKEQAHLVILAAKSHITVANIHPFIDGNGRTARLLMNFLLLKNGFPLVVIPPILRVPYITACKAANKGNDSDFLMFVATQVLQGQRDYLRLLG